MTTDSTPTPPDDAAASSSLPAPPPPASGPRRLTRSRRERMVAGVAGGLAEYFDLDPSLVRVALILLAVVSGGTALVLYVAAWIVLPESGEPAAAATGGGTDQMPRPSRHREGATGALIWGILLILAGGLLLARQADLELPPAQAILAGALMLVGVFLLIDSRRGLNGGLLVLAIVLAGALALTSRASLDYETGFSERNVAVARIEDLDESYGHAFGQLNLDLRDLAFPEGTTEVSVSVAFGSAAIRVPRDIPVRVEGDTLFGSTHLRGPQIDGFGVDTSRSESGYATAKKRLLIHVTTLFGSTEVQ